MAYSEPNAVFTRQPTYVFDMPQPFALPDYVSTSWIRLDLMPISGISRVFRQFQISRSQVHRFTSFQFAYRLPMRIFRHRRLFVKSVMVAGGDALRESTGRRRCAATGIPMMTQIIQALSGWQPTNKYNPLRFRNACRTAIRLGLRLLPLQFYTLYEVS